MANDIARYFHRKILNICNELHGIDVNQRRCSDLIDDPVFSSNIEPLRVFKELKEKDVYQLIQASPKKSSTLDPFQTSILLGSLEELLSIITFMVNCSLTLGHFPAAWKASLVDRQLKKRCQSASLSNLIPVSNLQFISKLTERAVYNQTQEHLVRSELYPPLQSAYRAGHSTETALLKVHNDMLLNMDNQRVTQLVLFDLSSAFNTVDHKVLLRRLEITFGIADTALQWFRSYLAGRSQRVLLNGSFSEDFSLPHGVPQGYCLGTLLFTIYASKPFEVTCVHTPILLSTQTITSYISHLSLVLVRVNWKR